MTDQDVADIVNNEGLGYAVQHYMGHENIKNPELASWWQKAKTSLDAIEEILGDKLDQ